MLSTAAVSSAIHAQVAEALRPPALPAKVGPRHQHGVVQLRLGRRRPQEPAEEKAQVRKRLALGSKFNFMMRKRATMAKSSLVCSCFANLQGKERRRPSPREGGKCRLKKCCFKESDLQVHLMKKKNCVGNLCGDAFLERRREESFARPFYQVWRIEHLAREDRVRGSLQGLDNEARIPRPFSHPATKKTRPSNRPPLMVKVLTIMRGQVLRNWGPTADISK